MIKIFDFRCANLESKDYYYFANKLAPQTACTTKKMKKYFFELKGYLRYKTILCHKTALDV